MSRTTIRTRGGALAASIGAAMLLAAPGVVPEAGAQQVVSRGGSFLDAKLLPGGRMDDGRQAAALVLKVKPGWKTYWRQPGEAGVPPEFDWTASGNLADIEVGWPAPVVFQSFGYQTLGYGGRVVLPLTLTPERAGEPVELRLSAMFGVCRDICVFEQVDRAVSVPPAASSLHDGVIAAGRAAMPLDAAASGVALEACRIAGAGETRAVTAEFSLPDSVGASTMPVIVVEGPTGSWVEPPLLYASADGDVALEAVMRLGSADAWVQRDDLRFTVLADGLAAEIRGCAPKAG
ncbi:MAG: protein-disulfide reductase DsbD domain-containing protein [Pseudomonadota bacterium]